MSTLLDPIEIHQEKLPFHDVSFPMIRVEGGKFVCAGQMSAEVSHFFIGQHLVSQELWEEIMGRNPSEWKGRDRPVESINWYDGIDFCNELSRRMHYDPFYEIDKEHKDPSNDWDSDPFKWTVIPRLGANGFRLPTEAEWEYAARGGAVHAPSQFSGSKDINRIGWYEDTGFSQTHPLGTKLPNGLGIYDMTGNLLEWCWDWYGDLPPGPLKDPLGAKRGRYRVLRGGSWHGSAQYCRVGFRGRSLPDTRVRTYGLRLSRTAM